MVYADVKRCLTSPLFSTPLFLEKRATNSFFPFAVKSGLRPEGDGSTLYTFWSQEFLFPAQVSRRVGCGCVRCGVETVDLENIRWLGMVYADVKRCLTSPLFSTPLFLEKRATNSFFPFAVKSGLRPEGDGSTLYTFWSQEFLFPAQVSRRVGCGCVRCGVETVDLENIRWLGMVYADVKRCLTSPLFSTPLFLEKRATNSFFPFAVKSGLRPEGDGSTLYTFWSQEFLCRLSGRFVLRRAYVSLFWTYKRECTNDLLYCVLRSLLTYLTGSFLRKCPDELGVAVCDAVWKPLI
ncbi:hypothetical protein PHYBLDRAFT_150783 [Phycomyces blakesleeanus NRRL 1555(-)]|uniref:Uncharacterized protein n=1 Tax=Phycomyces blakesleeanus (strain ATCC 8743b / DSM 1359 / FGSC 10004 / NBRC 33097 / NRRL 1555) TaxID=763407 RepID=A0A162N3D4_PHYB8|nr:hypothetical protein PHYBLDRAFT_150783 [Phycomyces blakesleeanus NRRL 1555(-)]OAD68118.1 hypothetical protein PHYBLDRAFT_150783 [Phycomyces blakesleeanus NRRL 1555(-)]|eukprot:XP_018286158.1 hypothetical protein PHYBLDRAFT_150783 [Phycomyces blakesleeanus NRRL 1555(-)]